MRPFDPRVLQTVPEVRPIVAGLGALGVAQGVVAVGQALTVARLVDALVHAGMPGAPELGGALALAGGVFALRAALAAWGERRAADAGLRVVSAVRVRLLRRWLSLPAEDRPDPDVARTWAVEGAGSIEPYVARFLPALVAAAVLPVLVVGTVAAVDWVSALIVLLTVPLLPLFAALIGRATEDSTARRWHALQALSGHYLDVVRGLPTLVAYGRAWRQARSIGEVSERHRAATMRTLRLAFLSSAALELLATISVAIVAVTVGLRLAGGQLGLAPGLAAILLAPEAYWPIRRVGTEYHNAADGAAALAQALDTLGRSDRAAEASTPSAGAHGKPSVRPIELRGLGYVYPGSERPVVRALTLEVPHPGLLVVTGPSGAGKSTLLELLAGIRRPSSGTVQAPVAHLVAQSPLLVPASLRDNLTLGIRGEVTDADLWQALDRLGLRADITAAGGLSGRLGDEGFGLSAGQRARLALARATLSDAPLVLLDEPAAHLDPMSADLVHAEIRRLARRRSVVVVTHRPELLEPHPSTAAASGIDVADLTVTTLHLVGTP
ncbi:MAG: thiol reductant ABC exporter subunit CydD [Dermatophilaceae bacterium]